MRPACIRQGAGQHLEAPPTLPTSQHLHARTREGVHAVLAGSAAVPVRHKTRQAPYAIAAHLRLAAVAVVYAHLVVRAPVVAGQREYHLLRACELLPATKAGPRQPPAEARTPSPPTPKLRSHKRDASSGDSTGSLWCRLST